MRVRPWYAFIVVAVLQFIGKNFVIAGGEDFMYFTIGTLIWGGLFAAIIWFATRKKENKK